MLRLLHPELPSCESCVKWQYDEQWNIEQWNGEPLLRVLPDKVPCRTDRGCPKGSPEAGRELTARNTRVYWHYRQCKAVHDWPDDPIVRYNAGIIAHAEESAAEMKEDRRQARQTETLVSVLKCLIPTMPR